MTQNKNIIITGCNSGLGYHLLIKSLERGCNVFAINRTFENLSDLKEKFHDQLNFITMDLSEKYTNWREIDGIFKEEVSECYLNAGRGMVVDFEKECFTSIENTVQVNLLFNIEFIHRYFKYIKSNKVKIAVTSSIAANYSAKGYNIYGLTKAGITYFIKTLLKESPSLLLYCYEIGGMHTPFHQKANYKGSKKGFRDPEYIASLIAVDVLHGKPGIKTLTFNWWFLKSVFKIINLFKW